MKRHTMLILGLTILVASSAASGQDFHPIADADYIGYPDTETGFAGRLTFNDPGPHSDAEWGPRAVDGPATVLVAANFDPLLDADFLDTTGYATGGGQVAYSRNGANSGSKCH